MRYVAFLMLLCVTSRATTVTTWLPEENSLGNPASVFDVSHAGNTYGVGPGTSFYPPPPAAFDVYDIFGGVSHTYEIGAALFADNLPIGTVDTVTVHLPAPVTLTSFRLYCGDDGIENGGRRSMREFRLYAGDALIDDLHLLDNSGSQSYTVVFGGPRIRIDEAISNPMAASDYTLQFVQNIPAGVGSGVRVHDFQAFVPEPASGLLVAAAGMLLLRRRKQWRSIWHS